MFDPDSRYADVPTAMHRLPDGREVPFKRRRLLPPGDSLPELARETVRPGDRMDLIAHRTLGNPEHFWRIADANDALDPHDILQPGRRLRIPLAQP